MDFVADRLHGGERLRMLTVVDVFTPECLAIEVGHRLGGEDVVHALDAVAVGLGAPRRMYCDNGAEFQSRLVDLWAYRYQVTMEFSRPGTTPDNVHIESFNGRFRDECLNGHWFTT